MKRLLVIGALLLAPALQAESMVVKKGKSFNIKLSSKPSTGYSWHLAEQPDSEYLRLEAAHYNPGANPHGLEDKDGLQTWQFKALKDGETTLRFAERKSWEGHLAPKQTKEYTISIKN